MGKHMDTLVRRSAKEGLTTLFEICGDPEQKSADRIAAAKVLVDIGMKQTDAEDAALKVIMEGVPGEYLK